jgi:hypothetical protein
MKWNPHTIHTHYFGFAVPEAEIGVFLYVCWMPAFSLIQGGPVIFQGLDNVHATDSLHQDYQMTMPWPQVVANAYTTANGLRVEFLEPGKRIRVAYDSGDGAASFDTIHEAVTPLLARGHIVPGEEQHHGAEKIAATGGTEQFMHVTGSLTIGDEQYRVDSYYPRDRSWGQVRCVSCSHCGGWISSSTSCSRRRGSGRVRISTTGISLSTSGGSRCGGVSSIH